MLWWLLVAVIASFGLIVLVGPPYLPTLNRQVEAALDLLELKPGQSLLELGSGDGRVMLAAARRGLRVTGIELNPFLVIFSRLLTWRYRRLVKVRWGNYWNTKLWPVELDGVFGFVLPRYMRKLDRLLSRWCVKPVKLASFAFEIPGKPVVRRRDGVLLYEYQPAPLPPAP